MPDTPVTDPNAFTYGVNERGDLLIDDVIVERNMNFIGDANEVPEDDESPPDRTNAAPEGESAVPEKAPEPEPVKPPEPAPEPPKIPEKQKYQLKIRGEMQEKEYSRDEIVARLQMAESHDARRDEFMAEKREIEPYLHVFKREDFKEWLQTKVAVGDIPAPAQPDPPANKDVIEYRLRTLDPEFNDIHQQMLSWAATLPDAEADILNRDHASYVRAFDQFKSTRKPVAPAPAPVVVPAKDVEKAIAAKEVIKAQARVEPPGGASEEAPDPQREWHKVDRQLKKAVQAREKSVIYNGVRMDPEMAWVMHRDQ